MRNRTQHRILILGLLVLAVFFIAPVSDAIAQCPMCRIGAETNLASGGSAGKGLNKGILMLLGIPYVIIATFGLIWWKNKKTPTLEE